MRLFKLLGQWLDFRAKLAILRFKFLYRVFVLCIEQHYLRFVLFFLSRARNSPSGASILIMPGGGGVLVPGPLAS